MTSTASSDTAPLRPETKRPGPCLRRWAVTGTVLAAVALTAAGCGSGGSKSSNGSTSQGTTKADSAQASGIAYAQCMRSHGVSNFPDNAISSSSGGGTEVNLPQGIANNPDYKSASQACQSQLPKGGNGGSSSANTGAELTFANCMRSHGVPNFPEPSSSGGMKISSGNGVDPNSPTFKSAMQTCRKDLPNGGQGSGAAG